MAEVNGNVNIANHTVPLKAQSYASRHQIADHFIGGNKLENAPSSIVKDFVKKHDGHTVITSVCISKKESELNTY